jgi:hypothetical protein
LKRARRKHGYGGIAFAVMQCMSHATITSPFNCRWIAEGSACELADTAMALCTRLTPEIVNVRDCERCEYWRPADDNVYSWRRSDECPHCGTREITPIFEDALLSVLRCAACGRWWTSSRSRS